MKILYVYADTPGGESYCSTWLCGNPAVALDRAGHNVGLVSLDDFVGTDIGADIVVIERLLWNGCSQEHLDSLPPGGRKKTVAMFGQRHVLDRIEEYQSKGTKVLAVFDDHYEAYPSGPEFERTRNYWLEGHVDGMPMGFLPIEDFHRGLGLVDAVMVPSQFLSEYYKKYAKRMYTIHNRPLLHNGGWPVLEKHRRGPLVVGWSGTAQHWHSWLGNDALLAALGRLRDRVIVRGVIPDTVHNILDQYRIIVDAYPPVPMNRFPEVVASYDVGICPLQGDYDSGRSWIKWLECSLMGKPVIASSLAGAYSECIGGFIVDDKPEEWLAAIEMMTSDELYSMKSCEGRAWAWAQGWDEHIGELTDIFEEVMDD